MVQQNSLLNLRAPQPEQTKTFQKTQENLRAVEEQDKIHLWDCAHLSARMGLLVHRGMLF